MLKEALEFLSSKFTEAAGPNIIEINGLKYTDGKLNLIRPPQDSTVSLHTLDGLVRFVAEEQTAGLDVCFVIESPSVVGLLSYTDKTYRDRVLIAGAEAILPDFHVYTASGAGRRVEFNEREWVMIAGQATFVKNDDRDRLLDLISHMVVGEQSEVSDDGVTQQVSYRTGAKLKEKVSIKNPFVLAPYRTFAEIDQPESPFILRLDTSGKIALVEADGGRWRLQAIERIETFIVDRLAEIGLDPSVYPILS